MDISELARYGVGAVTAYSFCKYVIAPFIENVREQKRISKSREMSAVYERCYNQTLEARKQTVDEIKKLYKLGPNTRVIHVQIDVPTGDDFIGTDGNPQDTLYSQIDTAFKDLRSWNSNE